VISGGILMIFARYHEKQNKKRAFPETKCPFKHTVHILKCLMVFAREIWIEIPIF